MPRRIRANRVGKMRYRLRVVQDRKRPRLRSILRGGRGGRLLSPSGEGPEQNIEDGIHKKVLNQIDAEREAKLKAIVDAATPP